MVKVSVFTSTRAEYGLLYWLIKELHDSADFELQLVVTGTHLSHEYGYTVTEIINDGFRPSEQIATLISDDSPQAITRSSALLAISLSDYFARERPDYFVVLGDRVELLSACEAALIAKVPIVHLHGGEITEGAVDEKVRHAVTKFADLHFTSTEVYRRRIIQMGENPDSVVNCGALGLESLSRKDTLSRELLAELIDIKVEDKYFLVVYHPETNKACEDMAPLLRVLAEYPEYKKIIIYPNSDVMSRDVITAITEFESKFPEQVRLIKSMGRDGYLSLIENCELYIGNSSSGIIEVPSFYRPIVNVGDRQKGRIRSASTIDVEMSYESISQGVRKALSKEFNERLPAMHSPYAGESPSKAIIDKLRSVSVQKYSGKRFFDWEFEV